MTVSTRRTTLSVTIECRGRTTRAINQELRKAIADGAREITVREPDARHNLGVALLEPVRVVFDGSVGYYCGGMMDGAHRGAAAAMAGAPPSRCWAAASSLTATPAVGWGRRFGGARSWCAAMPPRAGVSMKGGTLLIGGSCGYMAGFMMQKGRIVICGNAGEALADSMYEGEVFVGGQIASLGNDAVVQAQIRTILPSSATCSRSTILPGRRSSRRWSRAGACGTSTARTSQSGRWPCERSARSAA